MEGKTHVFFKGLVFTSHEEFDMYYEQTFGAVMNEDSEELLLLQCIDEAYQMYESHFEKYGQREADYQEQLQAAKVADSKRKLKCPFVS